MRDSVKPKAGNSRVLVHPTDQMILGPGKSLVVEYRYSVVLPTDFFYLLTFGTRTIDVTVTVDAPGFEISTDSEKDGPVWEFKRLFMIGDHLTMRWRPNPIAQLTSQ
jgi:hypothetical protein